MGLHGHQGQLFILHHIDHQLHAKPEAGDEHITFRDRGYVSHAHGELFQQFLLLVGEYFP